MTPGPDAVIAWVRSRGSDAEDLRDAAHEASHALQVRARRWDRESIHVKVMRRGERFAGTSELEARAVERLVCEAHGVEYNWAHWEMIALMEAGKNGVWLPTNLGLHIARLMVSPSVVARAKMILRCGEQQDSRKDMSGRHHVTPEQRLFVEERADDLAAAVPPNMVEGLRYMLQVSKGAGLSTVDAYASVMEALRAIQKPHKPQEKAWLALEAGIRWLEREQAKENT